MKKSTFRLFAVKMKNLTKIFWFSLIASLARFNGLVGTVVEGKDVLKKLASSKFFKVLGSG